MFPLSSFLEMAESKACEIGALPSGILHTGYLRKAGEACELLRNVSYSWIRWVKLLLSPSLSYL